MPDKLHISDFYIIQNRTMFTWRMWLSEIRPRVCLEPGSKHYVSAQAAESAARRVAPKLRLDIRCEPRLILEVSNG